MARQPEIAVGFWATQRHNSRVAIWAELHMALRERMGVSGGVPRIPCNTGERRGRSGGAPSVSLSSQKLAYRQTLESLGSPNRMRVLRLLTITRLV
jgi:hypothetical protein